MKKSLITLCIVFIGINASAQISPLLEKGQSGIGLKGTCESSYEFYSFGGKLGVSLKGNVDLELTYQNHIWGMEENNLLTNGATSDYYEGYTFQNPSEVLQLICFLLLLIFHKLL